MKKTNFVDSFKFGSDSPTLMEIQEKETQRTHDQIQLHFDIEYESKNRFRDIDISECTFTDIRNTIDKEL